MTKPFGCATIYLTERLIDKEAIRWDCKTPSKLCPIPAAEKFPVSGAAVSKHLSVLKDADLIRDTREGKFIFYELNTSVLEEVMLWLAQLKGETK